MKRFRPGIIPTLVVALLLPLLVSLGFWQLSRGAEKSALLQSYAERRAAEPMASTDLQHTADPAFRRVHLHGQFDAGHSLLLDNRQRDGKVGVELLQPFHDQATGLWLLVNRGWLPWPDRRTPPQFTTPDTLLSLDAWVYVPPGATFQLHADPNTRTWPKLLTAIDPSALWKALDREGYAYELRAETRHVPGRLASRGHGPGKTPRLCRAVVRPGDRPVRSLSLPRLAQRKGETPWERP